MTGDSNEVRIARLVLQVEHLMEKLGEQREEHNNVIAGLKEKITEQHADLKEELDIVKADVASISKMAERWRGATILILTVGGFIGWLINTWGGVQKVFR